MRIRTMLAVVLLLVGIMIGLSPAQAQVTTLRFLWFTDGPDKPAIEALVKRFNDTNADIKIEFSIVPFAELNQLLVTQASAGQAPDLARVTEPYRFFQHTLDLRPHLKNANFVKEFLDEPVKSVTGERGEFYGIPHDLTMNGPFVNVSLFKKAGVELPQGERVTWEEWMAAAAKVKKATGVPFAATADRSGHRLDGFLQSYRGGFFTPDGKDVRITSPETRKAVLNGYNLQAGGMPGGKFLVAFKNTKAPDKVARLVEFLGGADAASEYASKAMFLPTRKDLVRQGVKYPARNDDMNAFIKGVGQLPSSAYVDNYNLRFGQVANEVRDRVTQAIVGELSVDKALEMAQAKAKDLLKQ